MAASNRVTVPEDKRTFFHKFAKVNGHRSFSSDVRSPAFYRDILVEVLTTFFLNLAITSLVVQFPQHGGASPVRAALSIGLGVLVMAEGFGQFGSTHINPAVSFGMMAIAKISIWKGLLYIGAQCLGSIAGAATIFYTVPAKLRETISPLNVHAEMEAWQGAIIEGLITFLLVFVILGATDEKRRGRRFMPAVPIGLTIVTNISWSGYYTGGAMNPALLIGPAIITNKWSNHWAYWAGPMAGGFLAAVIYNVVFVGLTNLDEQQKKRKYKMEKEGFQNHAFEHNDGENDTGM